MIYTNPNRKLDHLNTLENVNYQILEKYLNQKKSIQNFFGFSIPDEGGSRTFGLKFNQLKSQQ